MKTTFVVSKQTESAVALYKKFADLKADIYEHLLLQCGGDEEEAWDVLNTAQFQCIRTLDDRLKENVTDNLAADFMKEMRANGTKLETLLAE